MTKKILLIDDNVELCNGLADLFRDEGYLVDNTSDNEEGAALIQKNKYDICLLDYKMKGLNGIDLLKLIKNVNAECAVFIVSGRAGINELIKEASAEDLVAGVFSKPFNIPLLLQKIKA
jgi:two-component system NtrC family response regulator